MVSETRCSGSRRHLFFCCHCRGCIRRHPRVRSVLQYLYATLSHVHSFRYAIEKMEGIAGLHGWQWIVSFNGSIFRYAAESESQFCLEGIVTVLGMYPDYRNTANQPSNNSGRGVLFLHVRRTSLPSLILWTWSHYSSTPKRRHSLQTRNASRSCTC